MAEQWKAGDVVQLKSGGPIMTVQSLKEIQGEPVVFCAWFDKNQKITGNLQPDMLERYSEPDI